VIARPVLRPLLLLCAVALPAAAQPWRPDLGSGRFRNPVVFADYSDPDVVRVGDDFYLTASSFGAVPGLPILHSRDLVNWRLIGHALPRLPADFDVPQHGNGVWAPAIRHHAGAYYIYWGDPDRGIYMVKARDPRGPWDAPVLVKAAKGWIDPAPLWDDDGQAYLVHAFARSRAGIKHRLHVARMHPDGTRLLDEGTLVFMDSVRHPTMEGPKFHKRDGWYYLFTPAGGVATGWQTVLRARTPLGPYEDRIVLAQGATAVNGPHQGAWVELANGTHWFTHFQDRGAYGRIVHLQPMTWRPDGWPVIGADPDGDGTGEPVSEWRTPVARRRCRTRIDAHGAADLRRVRRTAPRAAVAVAGEPAGGVALAVGTARRAAPVRAAPAQRGGQPVAGAQPAAAEAPGAGVLRHHARHDLVHRSRRDGRTGDDGAGLRVPRRASPRRRWARAGAGARAEGARRHA
jgi:hypothetical protein